MNGLNRSKTNTDVLKLFTRARLHSKLRVWGIMLTIKIDKMLTLLTNEGDHWAQKSANMLPELATKSKF